MLDKQRVLAVTKCDMLDQELDGRNRAYPASKTFRTYSSRQSPAWASPHLKDLLWEELNKESNKIEGKVESIAHRAKDMSHLKEELKARKARTKTSTTNTLTTRTSKTSKTLNMKKRTGRKTENDLPDKR